MISKIQCAISDSDSQTRRLRHSDSQNLRNIRYSESQAPRLSLTCQTLRLSDSRSQILRLSDSQTYVSDSQTLRLPETLRLRLSDPQTRPILRLSGSKMQTTNTKRYKRMPQLHCTNYSVLHHTLLYSPPCSASSTTLFPSSSTQSPGRME